MFGEELNDRGKVRQLKTMLSLQSEEENLEDNETGDLLSDSRKKKEFISLD